MAKAETRNTTDLNGLGEINRAHLRLHDGRGILNVLIDSLINEQERDDEVPWSASSLCTTLLVVREKVAEAYEAVTELDNARMLRLGINPVSAVLQ